MRGLDVRTPYCLADIAEHDAGFEVAGILQRSLDRDRRMMPYSKGATQIEQRMGTEEVIILKSPDTPALTMRLICQADCCDNDRGPFSRPRPRTD